MEKERNNHLFFRLEHVLPNISCLFWQLLFILKL